MPSASQIFYLAVFALLSPCKANQAEATQAQELEANNCAIEPQAIVSDACASFSDLDNINEAISPKIYSITHDTDFFSYYRLNLFNRECPFWSDANGMCGNSACAVSTLDNESDIPEIWRAEELSKLEGPKASHPGRKQQAERPKEKPLEGELGEEVGESCVVEYDDECDDRDYCVLDDEGAAAKGDYVSLLANPERFTGYGGQGARQVWNAVYRENCFSKEPIAPTTPAFSPLGGVQAANDLQMIMKEHSRQKAFASDNDSPVIDDTCLEKRVFYRLVSGLHASISIHLCSEYFNQTTGVWESNLQCYTNRIHSFPDRVSNLYFNYALLLRAVSKLGKHLEGYTFCSSDPTLDLETKQKVLELADSISTGPKIFDESMMFQDPSVPGLKEDFRNRFRNVSRLMDCIGCDKCRLWGKLQTAGYGTALKVLFEFDETKNGENPPLRRTELVALMNTLGRVSNSLKSVQSFRSQLAGLENKEKVEVEAAKPQESPILEAETEVEAAEEPQEPQEPPSPETNSEESSIPEEKAEEEAGEVTEAVAEEEAEEAPKPQETPVLEPEPETPAAPTEPQEPPTAEKEKEIPQEELLDEDLFDDDEDDDYTGPTVTVAEAFWEEWNIVWSAAAWVIKSWIKFPVTAWRILIMECNRLWHYWLGLPVMPRSWEFRFPTRDEL
ncbi:MAG: endoplasmic oxidoreductin-1 [Cirrosporium novae-zelandiae]|nr:MAG: endoplasmic oxidoreductin-1 [Cirrosporium novae-zelandiae]KAI9735643.1 MAG: endoplasmic oxidoreductin-1 [Cirrosporium novae-zelandiae]